MPVSGGTGSIAPYVALGNGGSPMVFPMDTMVNEVTAAENPSDVGIKVVLNGSMDWHGSKCRSARGCSCALRCNGRATRDKSVHRVLPRREYTTDHAAAINSGLALAVETKGRTQPAAGFFGHQIALGPEVNDNSK